MTLEHEVRGFEFIGRRSTYSIGSSLMVAAPFVKITYLVVSLINGVKGYTFSATIKVESVVGQFMITILDVYPALREYYVHQTTFVT